MAKTIAASTRKKYARGVDGFKEYSMNRDNASIKSVTMRGMPVDEQAFELSAYAMILSEDSERAG